jgi:Ca2+-binding EF-hand superfamily protein
VNEIVDALKASTGGRKMSDYEIERFMKKVDSNGDKKISKEELANVFRGLNK